MDICDRKDTLQEEVLWIQCRVFLIPLDKLIDLRTVDRDGDLLQLDDIFSSEVNMIHWLQVVTFFYRIPFRIKSYNKHSK